MTVQKYSSNTVTLYNGDGLAFLKTLEDNSVDVVLTDPPYFQVKSDAWDNQWANEAQFLDWLDDYLAKFWRVLKPSGSLYLFCSPRLSSATEARVKTRFNVLNHIVWNKPHGSHSRADKSVLRRYFGASERIIFAEHYGAEGYAKGQANVYEKTQSLRGRVFAPLIEYFKQAREQAGISAKAINEVTGTQMCSHWFSYSQWTLPNAEQYQRLQSLFKRYSANELNRSYENVNRQFGELHRSYTSLLQEHDGLRAEYEQYRRPFKVSSAVPYTDVWTFNPVQPYPGKHVCEKPAPLLEHILKASARPGMVVLDPFFGSGAVCHASLKAGCRFIGAELDPHWYQQLVDAA